MVLGAHRSVDGEEAPLHGAKPLLRLARCTTVKSSSKAPIMPKKKSWSSRPSRLRPRPSPNHRGLSPYFASNHDSVKPCPRAFPFRLPALVSPVFIRQIAAHPLLVAITTPSNPRPASHPNRQAPGTFLVSRDLLCGLPLLTSRIGLWAYRGRKSSTAMIPSHIPLWCC